MRAARLELARDFSHKILNLARLPLRHAGTVRVLCDGSDSNRQNLSALNGATLPFCPPSHKAKDLVRVEEFESPRSCDQQGLSLPRLPVPPYPHCKGFGTDGEI